MAEKSDTLKKTIRKRAAAYALFSRILRKEADLELLSTLKNNCFSLDGEGEGFYLLKRFFEDHEITEKLMEELAADFASLFLGTGERPAHPYASVYLGGGKTVMGDQRNRVLEIYGEEYLKKAGWFREPEDHIAVELEFMAHLCLSLLKALERDDMQGYERKLRLQTAFYRDHLKTWVPEFCADVTEGSAHKDFYRAFGGLLKEFIAKEDEQINRMNRVPDEET
jgi:anaerobic sulfite reductase subunit A